MQCGPLSETTLSGMPCLATIPLICIMADDAPVEYTLRLALVTIVEEEEEEERLFGKINVHYAKLHMIGYASETPIKTYNNVASMGATTIIMINTTYIINIYI